MVEGQGGAEVNGAFRSVQTPSAPSAEEQHDDEEEEVAPSPSLVLQLLRELALGLPEATAKLTLPPPPASAAPPPQVLPTGTLWLI